MTLCSANQPVYVDIGNWRKALCELIGPNAALLKNLEWIDIGMRAKRGDDAAISEARKALRRLRAQLQSDSAQVIRCASRSVSAVDCVSAQVGFLIGIQPVMYKNGFHTGLYTYGSETVRNLLPQITKTSC